MKQKAPVEDYLRDRGYNINDLSRILGVNYRYAWEEITGRRPLERLRGWAEKHIPLSVLRDQERYSKKLAAQLAAKYGVSVD